MRRAASCCMWWPPFTLNCKSRKCRPWFVAVCLVVVSSFMVGACRADTASSLAMERTTSTALRSVLRVGRPDPGFGPVNTGIALTLLTVTLLFVVVLTYGALSVMWHRGANIRALHKAQREREEARIRSCVNQSAEQQQFARQHAEAVQRERTQQDLKEIESKSFLRSSSQRGGTPVSLNPLDVQRSVDGTEEAPFVSPGYPGRWTLEGTKAGWVQPSTLPPTHPHFQRGPHGQPRNVSQLGTEPYPSYLGGEHLHIPPRTNLHTWHAAPRDGTQSWAPIQNGGQQPIVYPRMGTNFLENRPFTASLQDTVRTDPRLGLAYAQAPFGTTNESTGGAYL